jgi:hypothetical protein
VPLGKAGSRVTLDTDDFREIVPLTSRHVEKVPDHTLETSRAGISRTDRKVSDAETGPGETVSIRRCEPTIPKPDETGRFFGSSRGKLG